MTVFRSTTRSLPKLDYSFMATIMLTLLYGGADASTWNSHFPNPLERDLWRISCGIISSPSLVILGVAALAFALTGVPAGVIPLAGTVLLLVVYILTTIFEILRLPHILRTLAVCHSGNASHDCFPSLCCMLAW